MNSNSKKEQERAEIEEILRRLEYLKNTDQISVPEKMAILKQALKIVAKDRLGKGVV